MKKLGQHFLKNQSVAKTILAAIDPRAGETIIEIGPGHGELTIPLADICKRVGAKLVAIEKDPTLAAELEQRTMVNELEGVKIIHGDILELLPSWASPSKIIGNIPYYITGHLLRIVGELGNKPERVILMIQREVAERICATPPKMNRLAASIQFWAEPKIIARVPKEDFSPPPEVDSAVIELATRQPQPKNAERYYAAVRALFAQPRKTILNNISDARQGTSAQKGDAAALLGEIGLDAKSRPQNLTIENINAVAEAFF